MVHILVWLNLHLRLVFVGLFNHFFVFDHGMQLEAQVLRKALDQKQSLSRVEGQDSHFEGLVFGDFQGVGQFWLEGQIVVLFMDFNELVDQVLQVWKVEGRALPQVHVLFPQLEEPVNVIVQLGEEEHFVVSLVLGNLEDFTLVSLVGIGRGIQFLVVFQGALRNAQLPSARSDEWPVEIRDLDFIELIGNLSST